MGGCFRVRGQKTELVADQTQLVWNRHCFPKGRLVANHSRSVKEEPLYNCQVRAQTVEGVHRQGSQRCERVSSNRLMPYFKRLGEATLRWNEHSTRDKRRPLTSEFKVAESLRAHTGQSPGSHQRSVGASLQGKRTEDGDRQGWKGHQGADFQMRHNSKQEGQNHKGLRISVSVIWRHHTQNLISQGQ